MKHLLLLLIATTMCGGYIENECYAQTAQEWYSEGEIAYQNQNYNNAKYYFTQAIRNNYTPLKKAYVYRGMAKDNLGDHMAAIRDYNRAIKSDNNYAKAYNKRGVAKNNLNQNKSAINDYNKAIELDVSYAAAYNNRGNVKKKLEQYPEAIADYDNAIELDENYADAYKNRANAKRKLERYSEAIADYDKVIELDPNHYIAYNGRGYCYLKSQDYRSAVADWNTMENLASSSYTPYPNYIVEARQKLQDYPNYKPIITWENPILHHLKTEIATHTLNACIESESPIKVVLYKDQKLHSTRDITRDKVKKSTCNYYEYEQQVELTSRNTPTYLTLEVTNNVGTVTSERIIEVKDTSLQEKRLALVIGNSKYENGSRLENPYNDAKDIKDTLIYLGFKANAYYDLKKDSLEQIIDTFGSDLKNYDVGLFFYAGHGIQYDGKNYLVPIDANSVSNNNVKYKCVDVGYVLSNMEDAKSDVNIVILDACRNAPFKANSKKRSINKSGFIPTTGPKGTIIIYSADAGELADDNPSGKNGLFTGELLKYIAKSGLKIEDILKRTGQSVFEKSGKQQMPATYSKFWGDFYFKR